MNDYLRAVILGIIEGLTEFLPVSSTAHLRLAQDYLQIDLKNEYWKMFAIVIQLGAILSVVVYFWNKLLALVRTFPHGGASIPDAGGEPNSAGVLDSATRPPRTWYNHPLALVLIAFVVTAIPCYLIDKKIGENLESLLVIGLALLIGGVVMWVVDVACTKPRTLDVEEMTFGQAMIIGFAQIFAAAFPGTSRSMSTIAAGQIAGLSRSAALEFSFFLSIPVMFAATGFKLLQFIRKSPIAMTQHQWVVLAIGFIVSFIVALAAIHWFLKWVKRHGFLPFAIYRVIVGAAVLALLWRHRA